MAKETFCPTACKSIPTTRRCSPGWLSTKLLTILPNVTAMDRLCVWEKPTSMTVEAIPTGALSLDMALGVGGIPRGRITEIYGPEVFGQDHDLPAHCR